MKRKWIVFWPMVVMLLSLSIPAFAAPSAPMFWDIAGVMDEADTEILNQRAEALSETYGCGLPILLVDEVSEDGLMADAENAFYDYAYGYGQTESGLLMMIAVHTGDYALISLGAAEEVFTEESFDNLGYVLVEPYSNDDLLGAFTAYYDLCAAYLSGLDVDAIMENLFASNIHTDEIFGMIEGVKPNFIMDYAGFLTTEEAEALEGIAQSLSVQNGVDVAILTLSSINGDLYPSAVHIYETYSYGQGDDKNGALLVIDESTWSYAFICHGTAKSAMLDGRQALVEDAFLPYLIEDEYVNGFRAYMDTFIEIHTFWAEGGFETVDMAVDTTITVPGLIPGVKPNYVTDQAGLLTVAEIAALNAKASILAATYGCDVAIITVADMGGGSAFTHAMDIFDKYAYGQGEDKSGILLLLSDADRDFAFVCHGYANTAFTDYGQAKIEDAFLPMLGRNAYNQAFETFIDKCGEYLKYASEGRIVDVNFDPEEEATITIVLAAFAVAIPLLVAFCICSAWKRQMKTAVKQTTANAYIPAGGFALTGQSDMFLYKTETRRKIETSSSSGRGGTSTNSRGFSGRSGKY